MVTIFDSEGTFLILETRPAFSSMDVKAFSFFFQIQSDNLTTKRNFSVFLLHFSDKNIVFHSKYLASQKNQSQLFFHNHEFIRSEKLFPLLPL